MQRSPAQIREHTQAVAEVREYMRQRRLAVADLVEIGGEDLRSSNPALAGKARLVERCWALMARLGVKHVDLESTSPGEFATTAVSEAASGARRRRGGKSTRKSKQNQHVDYKQPTITNLSEINGLAVSSPVEAPAMKSAEIPAANPTTAVVEPTPCLVPAPNSVGEQEVGHG
jgi:hypothetical protein